MHLYARRPWDAKFENTDHMQDERTFYVLIWSYLETFLSVHTASCSKWMVRQIESSGIVAIVQAWANNTASNWFYIVRGDNYIFECVEVHIYESVKPGRQRWWGYQITSRCQRAVLTTSNDLMVHEQQLLPCDINCTSSVVSIAWATVPKRMTSDVDRFSSRSFWRNHSFQRHRDSAGFNEPTSSVPVKSSEQNCISAYCWWYFLIYFITLQIGATRLRRIEVVRGQILAVTQRKSLITKLNLVFLVESFCSLYNIAKSRRNANFQRGPPSMILSTARTVSVQYSLLIPSPALLNSSARSSKPSQTSPYSTYPTVNMHVERKTRKVVA